MAKQPSSFTQSNQQAKPLQNDVAPLSARQQDAAHSTSELRQGKKKSLPNGQERAALLSDTPELQVLSDLSLEEVQALSESRGAEGAAQPDLVLAQAQPATALPVGSASAAVAPVSSLPVAAIPQSALLSLVAPEPAPNQAGRPLLRPCSRSAPGPLRDSDH